MHKSKKIISAKNFSKLYIRIVFVVICLIYPVFLLSEIDPVDLEHKLPYLNDQEKISALLELSEYYKEITPQLSYKYALSALEISNASGNKEYTNKSLITLGNSYISLSRFAEAIDVFKRSLADNTNKQDKALVFSRLGHIYRTIGALDKALEFNMKALKLSRESKDSALTAESMSSIGRIYGDMGDYPESIDYYENAIIIYSKLKNQKALIGLYLNIANMYIKENKPDKALAIQNTAAKMAVKFPYMLQQIYLGLGESYLAGSKLPLALSHFQSALKKSTEFGNTYGVALALKGIGVVSFKMKKYNEAFDFLTKAQDIFIFEDIPHQLAETYNMKSMTLKEMGDYRSAYQYHLLYMKLRDSMYSEENANRISRLQVEFEFEKTNNKLAVLNNEKKIKEAELKNREFFLIAAALILVLLLSLVILLIRRSSEKIRSNHTLTKLNTQLEIKNVLLEKSKEELKESNALKDKFYSIIAHDIRNPLNPIGIGIEILKNRSKMNLSDEKMDRVIGDLGKSVSVLSDLLGNLLQWTNFQKGKMPFNPVPVDLTFVVKTCTDLFKENINQKNIILFSEIANDAVAFADANMVSVIFRNLIQNAIKFTPKGGVIKIAAINKNNFIEIQFIDTGVGMPPEIVNNLFSSNYFHTSEGTFAEKGTGLGLKLCKEFVDKHNGIITCKSAVNSGTTFRLKLPSYTNSD